MRSVVVYESMFGNTHLIAEAIADALRPVSEVVVVPVEEATTELDRGADLLVVGGPTHAHGMSRASSRASAAEQARKPDADVELEDNAEGPGLREWFDSLGQRAVNLPAAAFDTRVKGPALLTGRASKGIARRLDDLGCTLVTEPKSFLVDFSNHLLDDEEQHARAYGARLAAVVAARPTGSG